MFPTKNPTASKLKTKIDASPEPEARRRHFSGLASGEEGPVAKRLNLASTEMPATKPQTFHPGETIPSVHNQAIPGIGGGASDQPGGEGGVFAKPRKKIREMV